MDGDVFVEDVGDLTTRARQHGCGIAWVRLDIDSLEWVVESVIPEGDIPHAVVIVPSRNRADCHTNSKVDLAVTNNDVFRTGGEVAIVALWLDGDRVVVVGDVQSLNYDVLASNINAICVQSIGGDGESVSNSVIVRE
jgi:hypothetical protein